MPPTADKTPRPGENPLPSRELVPRPALPSGSDRDAGGSRERTRLSWRRTTLSATAVTLLLGRLALMDRAWVIAAVAALIWVVLLALIQGRMNMIASPQRLRFRLLASTSLACLSFAVVGVVAVVR